MSGTSTQPFGGSYNLSNLTAPASGTTHAAKFNLTFSGAGTVQINMLGYMEFLGDFQGQSMQVDNQANATSLTITELRYGWTRTVPAGALQTFQYPAIPDQVFNITAGGAGTAIVSVFDWPAFPDDGAVIAGGSVTVTVPQPLRTIQQQEPAQAGASDTITTGGTSQVIIAAGAITQQGIIKNPNAATESFFVDLVNPAGLTDGAGGTTFELKAGDIFIVPPLTTAVNGNAVTTGHAFTVTVV